MSGTYPGYHRFLKPFVGTGLDPGRPIASGIAVAWPMVECGGASLFDLSGNGSPLSLTSGVSWSPGRSGPCLTFNGSGYGTAPGAQLNSWGSTGLTVAGWFRTTATLSGGQRIVEKGANSEWWIDWFTGDVIRWNVSGFSGSAVTSASAMNDGAWHHFAGVLVYGGPFGGGFNNGFATLYIDGVSQGSTGNVFPSATPATGSLSVGQYGGGGFNYNGQLDGLYIWSRALSAAEVGTLYADPYGMFLAPPARRFFAMPSGGGGPVVGSASGGGTGSGVALPTVVASASGGGSGSGQASAGSTALAKGGGTGSGAATVSVLASASGGGSGSGQASVSVVSLASGGGTGSGAVVPQAGNIVATASGGGTGSGVASATVEVVALGGGSGSGAAMPSVVALASGGGSGSGRASVSVAALARGGATGSGSVVPTSAYSGPILSLYPARMLLPLMVAASARVAYAGPTLTLYPTRQLLPLMAPVSATTGVSEQPDPAETLFAIYAMPDPAETDFELGGIPDPAETLFEIL